MYDVMCDVMSDVEMALVNFRRDNLLKCLSADTVKYYDTMLEAFSRWLSARGLTALSQKCVDDYKIYLINTQKSKVSVNTHLRAVRRLLNFLNSNIIVQEIKTETMPKQALSEEDIRLIINAVVPTKKYSVIALLLLSTGIRSATARAIRTCDVNIEERNIILRHTKNKKPYVLPIAEKLADVLQQYIFLNGKKPDEPLFTTNEGRELTNSALWRRLAKFFERIGVKKTGIHIFRHTFAKEVCKNGLNNAIILMRLLGHSSIQQAQHYVNLYGNELSAAMEKYNPINM